MQVTEHGNVMCDKCGAWMPTVVYIKDGYIGPRDKTDAACPFTEFVCYCPDCEKKE